MFRKEKRNWMPVIAGSVSVAILMGIVLYAYFDEEANHHVRGIVNREKVKAYVKHHLKGSDELVDVVSGLSDDEVNTLVGIFDKTQTAKKQLGKGFNQIVDRAKELTNDAGDKVQNIFE